MVQDDGKPAAHPPQREQLHEGADAGDEHGVLNERGPQVFGKAGRCRNDRDGREVRHEHGQHVLQAIGEGRKPADLAIKGRERLHLRVDENHAALAFHVSLVAHERNSMAPVAGSMASTMARDCKS